MIDTKCEKEKRYGRNKERRVWEEADSFNRIKSIVGAQIERKEIQTKDQSTDFHSGKEINPCVIAVYGDCVEIVKECFISKKNNLHV